MDGIVSADVYVGIVNRSPMSYVWTIKVSQNSLIAHESYDASTISNDIALVRLVSAIPQHASVNYISLPRRAEVNENLVGKAGIISGFGRDSDSKYRLGKFENIDNIKCFYRSQWSLNNFTLGYSSNC